MFRDSELIASRVRGAVVSSVEKVLSFAAGNHFKDLFVCLLDYLYDARCQ
jgi:hypothetical protein